MLTCKWVSGTGRGEPATMKIICKFRKSHPELLYKKADLKCLKNFRETLMMRSCFNKIAKWRCVTLLKEYSTTLVILGVFQNLQNNHCYFTQLLPLLDYVYCIAAVIGQSYFYIVPIHFHLNHHDSHGRFQLHVINLIMLCCCFALLHIVCFRSRLEIM